MEMTGEQHIPVPQETVWRALNDLDVLKACIPGCETIVPAGENQFDVALTAKVGPVSAKFKGKLSLADLNPPHSYSLSFEGQGGVAGFAKGGAQVTLTPDGADTRLGYAVKANVGGKLAQIGSRLIDGAARKLAEQFFVAFNKHVAAAQPPGKASEI
jgi:carbon monoxide dehydrogenase subunit G